MQDGSHRKNRRRYLGCIHLIRHNGIETACEVTLSRHLHVGKERTDMLATIVVLSVCIGRILGRNATTRIKSAVSVCRLHIGIRVIGCVRPIILVVEIGEAEHIAEGDVIRHVRLSIGRIVIGHILFRKCRQSELDLILLQFRHYLHRLGTLLMVPFMVCASPLQSRNVLRNDTCVRRVGIEGRVEVCKCVAAHVQRLADTLQIQLRALFPSRPTHQRAEIRQCLLGTLGVDHSVRTAFGVLLLQSEEYHLVDVLLEYAVVRRAVIDMREASQPALDGYLVERIIGCLIDSDESVASCVIQLHAIHRLQHGDDWDGEDLRDARV